MLFVRSATVGTRYATALGCRTTAACGRRCQNANELNAGRIATIRQHGPINEDCRQSAIAEGLHEPCNARVRHELLRLLTEADTRDGDALRFKPPKVAGDGQQRGVDARNVPRR